ncbi:MAG: hypothetical protein J7M25_17715 [Deltaproteobacteria bacterium]|nr:hypothetical protein [Deltaproteobacteria bacterium]
MQAQEHDWTYSEMVGALLRQERGNDDNGQASSVIEQLVTQLRAGRSVDHLEMDLTGLVSCPDCEPEAPCAKCRADQAEMDREIRDHMRRVAATGTDLVTYLTDADQFHQTWQDRFNQLHLAAMGGEAFCSFCSFCSFC